MVWKPKYSVGTRVYASKEFSSVGQIIFFGETGTITFFDVDVPKWYRVRWDRLGFETNAHESKLKAR